MCDLKTKAISSYLLWFCSFSKFIELVSHCQVSSFARLRVKSIAKAPAVDLVHTVDCIPDIKYNKPFVNSALRTRSSTS